ncbi:MAG: CBS domain-containing protein [Candidatus Lokiarchaeota archaeon]|nr:CBS domain-containing protein [Candidatus Lokiarchaeota archaeon]
MKILPDLLNIKTLRKSLNISQKELGQILEIPQSTISRIENETMDPPYSKFKKIYEFLVNERRKREQTENVAADIMTKQIYSIDSNSTMKDAMKIMNKYSISQIPILEDNGQNLGSITSKKIQKLIIDNPALINTNVMNFKELPFPEVEKTWNVKDISNLLVNYSAVLVKEFDEYLGIITDSNFLKLTLR